MSVADAAIDVPGPVLDLLRQILDGLPLAIFLVDADMRIHRLNEAAAESLGLVPENVIRQRAGDALSCLRARDAPHGCGSGAACGECPIRRSAKDALAAGHRITSTTLFEIAAADGQLIERTLSVTAAPLASHERTYVLLTLEDVTELLRLRGLIPRCAWCGRMRDDDDYWQSVEEYLQSQHDVQVSHGICPDCAAKL